MILTDNQIREIILNNPGKARVQKGREYSKKLRRHIYGEGMGTFFQTIEGYERPKITELRNKYSKSNKDLFSRLSRPLDKIFTAKGGSVYLNLPTQLEQRANGVTQNVKNGISVRKWIETHWRPHLLDDPYGIIFLEIAEKQKAIQLRQMGESFVSPVYRSITEIYDYLPKGNKLEWVVFEVTKEEKIKYTFKPEDIIYRVVDDAKDYLVKKEGETVIIYDKEPFTFINLFGEVPAMVNSDIADPLNENCFLSLYDDTIELAEEFLLDGSVKRVHKFMHGFPKYAEFASDCDVCNGTQKKNGEDCKACNGSGRKIMARVSDIKQLDTPSKDEHLILPANVAAYISPDKVFFEIASTELSDLENLMTITLWGTHSKVQTQGMGMNNQGDAKTATEIMDEIKPQSDRLIPVSEMAEKRDKFIRDAVIRLNLSLPNYKGASVNYGRRYMLESPDAIWLKYSDARAKGAPQNVLDTLLNEYYEANYQSDPIGLALAKKLMYVEPFVHFTPQNLKALTPDPADYKAKLYFSEWLATVNESELLLRTVDELKADLVLYAATKNIPEPKALPAA